MLATMRTLWVSGARVCPTVVEVDVRRNGPRVFSLIGEPKPAARKMRELLGGAFANCGFEFPAEPVHVNLAPASAQRPDLAPFHLPIATALLLATGQIEHGRLSATAMAGELAPDGSLCPLSDVWAMAEAALALQLAKRLVVPAANSGEAAGLDGIEVVGVESLRQVPALASA